MDYGGLIGEVLALSVVEKTMPKTPKLKKSKLVYPPLYYSKSKKRR